MALQRLRFTTRNYSIQHYLIDADREDKFELNAPYQRGSVWGLTERVALIKSLFMGLPFGVVHLNNRGTWVGKFMTVVDGKQRIEALRAFHADGFRVPTEWFTPEELIKNDGAVAFSDLTPRMQSRFLNSILPAMEYGVETEKEEAEIFTLINTAGVAQTAGSLARAAAVAGE